MPSRIRGFTLVELLVVIAICVMLLGLLFPMIETSRSHSPRSICMANQSQVALALLNYENLHDHFPGWRQTLDNGREITWTVALLAMNAGNCRMKTCPSHPTISMLLARTWITRTSKSKVSTGCKTQSNNDKN